MEKKRNWIIIIVCLFILLVDILPANNVHALPDREAKVLDEVNSYIPMGQQMVDSAVEVLSKGLSNMSPEEREQFEKIFDPSQSGTVDDEYVEAVLKNYKKIQNRLEKSLVLEYEEDNDMCENMRLYYTDLFKVHICPYINSEKDVERKARVLVHEVAHMALLAGDRPYYHPKTYSSRYNGLTPRGSWTSQIPVIGPIFREISRSDTLYHPDAYAWFASLMFSNSNSG